jgi:hypothetical protein
MKKITLLVFLAAAYCVSYAQSAGALQFYWDHYAKQLKNTNYGSTIPKNVSTPSGKASLASRDFVHIFMDEFGNLISNNLPNGVPWVNYVIHIIHPVYANESFGVTQTSGIITGSFTIKGAGNSQQNPSAALPEGNYGESFDTLSPSDKDNIVFQVSKTTTDGLKATKETIGSYTITMSGYFNASLDIGIINSKLANPAYTLVNSPTTAGTMVVKQGDAGDRVMTTIMGTLYFSPVAWFERNVLENNTPLFKVKGQSSLANYNLLEKLYPTFGLSINEHTFQNIFYGVNWEFIRGGSLFLGWHTGKINTYTNPTPGFAFGSTPVTQDAFNYQQDTKWATKFAVGATVDLRLVLGLLSTQIK